MAQSVVQDHDRDAFGHWLSGFTDGEGCFYLGAEVRRSRRTPVAWLSLSLRADDAAILEAIRDYLGCGKITGRPRSTSRPQTELRIIRTSDLMLRVVPHFERYPLRAKKARDFVIWKEAVTLFYRVSLRIAQGRPRRQGTFAKWTDAERVQFDVFRAALRAQRVYDAPAVVAPEAPPPARGLFDGVA